MSKFFNMSIILLGTILLLTLAGVHTAATDILASFGLIDGDVMNSNFYLLVFAIFSSVGALGITMGFFGRTSWDWAVLSIYALAPLTLFFGSIPPLISYAATFEPWIKYLVFSIYTIMGVAYILSLLDWVFNRQ